VQLIGALSICRRDARGFDIGGNRVLPVADAGEDVRRHVQSMRRAGGDLGIAPGGIEAFLRDGRSVVEMNQIMRHARMLRLTLEDRLQNGRPFELIGVGLVGRRS